VTGLSIVQPALARSVPPAARFRHDFHTALPRSQKLDDYIKKLWKQTRFEGIQDVDIGNRLFGPALRDLRVLPSGVLLRKDEAVPVALVPNSRPDLELFVRRLIHRGGDPELVEVVLAGWPKDCLRRSSSLYRLSEKLHALRTVDRGLYYSVLIGGDRTLIGIVPQKRLPSTVDPKELVHIVANVMLAWAANDLQMIIADLHRADHRPFGKLRVDIGGGKHEFRDFFVSCNKLITPTAVVNAGRELWPIANEFMYRLRGMPVVERNARLKEIFQEHPEIEATWRQIQARLTPASYISIKAILNDTMTSAQGLVGYAGADQFWHPVTNATQRIGLDGKTFCHLWYGMSSLQAAAVAIWRYLQLEQSAVRIAEQILMARGGGDRLPRIDFGRFNRKMLQRGTAKRASYLLDIYRRTILNDVNWRTKTSTGEHFAGAPFSDVGGSALRAAAMHLERLGARKVADKDCPDATRKTFYFLDVIPDVRFSRIPSTSVTAGVPAGSGDRAETTLPADGPVDFGI
jgi:hypothetical protein